jgi:glutathione S-transferase
VAAAVLYRCPNPTNWLCPCGRVARELRKHGIDFEQIRVPYRRRDRPEVEELTGQQRVPLVLLDEQAIVDSRRIVEYLRWRALQ